MDFSKFDLLETKITFLIDKVTESEAAKVELTNKLSEAEETINGLKQQLSETEDSLDKTKGELNKFQRDNEALAEIQESAKAKIEDLIKDRQITLSRVETLLEKIDSWS
jgi:chromosome segregation ATPase